MVEYLQTATHPQHQNRGLGKLLTVVGRMLLDQFRDCLSMPPVDAVEVSTADTNRAQDLYRNWLLDPAHTDCSTAQNMFFGQPEVFLSGSVRPYEELLAKLDRAGFRLVT